MKTIEKYFADWESHVFGFGYGTGEKPVLTALWKFFAAFKQEEDQDWPSYDYEELQVLVGKTETWLLINTLCHADVIEYGTSPRFGWLTDEGKRVREFVISHTVEELINFTSQDNNYVPCYPDYCNCDDGPCNNPFWAKKI